jgi:rhamnogalacturonyl hydrolase YesR
MLSIQTDQKILKDVLDASEKMDYSGYCKFDALNSAFLKKISFNSKWLRLACTQFVKEMPFHIRPLLGVTKSRNPKGIALFVRAYLFLYQSTSDPEFLRKAEILLQWLLENPSPNYKHLCWGYNFVWQNTIFLQDKFEPNAVVTIFVGEAFIHAYRITKNKKYLNAALSISKFILNDLPKLHDTNDEMAIAYVLRKVDAVVLNNQVLAGALLAKTWSHTNENHLLNAASKLMNYTIKRTTGYHAWHYTYPKEKSPITHDNYHTGGILDGLLEYFEETGDSSHMDIYWKGLKFYQKNLFELNGAPRWMNDRKYPFDIHGSAQGIITFIKASRHNAEYQGQAEIIFDWAVKNLYREKTHDFAYRKGQILKWNYSLMRWCNAWMSRAIAEMIQVMEKKENTCC